MRGKRTSARVTLGLRGPIDTSMADSSLDPFTVAFGKRVAAARDAAGLSQTAYADACGMKRAYIWRVESGRTLPLMNTAVRMAAGLDMTLSELVEGLDGFAGHPPSRRSEGGAS